LGARRAFRRSEAHTLSERLKEIALGLGFDLAGVAPLRATPEALFLREWIAHGYQGEMHYLARRLEERIDPSRVLEGARSALVVGLVYDPASRPPLPPGSGAVARYAGGDDYHHVMTERLAAVATALEALVGRAFHSKVYVDTGPVLERVLGAYAGLGWMGKNTCLIDVGLGSYFFLGVLLTDLELAADAREPDHCGTCRACLDACPTQAFPRPYVLDATRCLSYTTIELRGAIPESLRATQGSWIFGCDVCQEVCPWNQRQGRSRPADPLGLRRLLRPRREWVGPSLAWLLGLDEAAWRTATRGTALRRAKHRGLLRNALIAAGNSGERSLLPSVRPHARSGDPLLAEHARWALRRLEATDDGAPSAAAEEASRAE
jgi:epoxyqueuosine reductase